MSVTRQYTRRETANQTNPDGTEKVEEPVVKDDDADTSTDGGADDKADETEAPKATAPTTEASVKGKKPRTRSQLARDKAAADEKAREKGVLESSPLWQVIYPTGISVSRPDEDEISVDVNGVDTDVEVVNGFAHIPMNGRVRADSLAELSNFADLAGQGMLRQVLESAS